MKAIDVLVAPGSSEASKAEVTHNCCPQDFKKLKGVPAVCGGDPGSATLSKCEECWGQEV